VHLKLRVPVKRRRALLRNSFLGKKSLFELIVFPNGRYDDQVDSTSQALAWVRDGYDKNQYGVLEFYKLLAVGMMAPKVSESHVCTKCNKEMTQRLPRGFRCAHCGEQRGLDEETFSPSRYDFLNKQQTRTFQRQFLDLAMHRLR